MGHAQCTSLVDVRDLGEAMTRIDVPTLRAVLRQQDKFILEEELQHLTCLEQRGRMGGYWHS